MAYRDENEARRAALAAKDDEIARLRGGAGQTREEMQLEAERDLIRLKSSIQSRASDRRAAGPMWTLLALSCMAFSLGSCWRAYRGSPLMLLLALGFAVVGLWFARKGTAARRGR